MNHPNGITPSTPPPQWLGQQSQQLKAFTGGGPNTTRAFVYRGGAEAGTMYAVCDEVLKDPSKSHWWLTKNGESLYLWDFRVAEAADYFVSGRPYLR